jgi:hypothetical protein
MQPKYPPDLPPLSVSSTSPRPFIFLTNATCSTSCATAAVWIKRPFGYCSGSGKGGRKDNAEFGMRNSEKKMMEQRIQQRIKSMAQRDKSTGHHRSFAGGKQHFNSAGI